MSADTASFSNPSRSPFRVPRFAQLSGPLLGLLAVLALFIVLIGIKGELHNFLSPRNLQVLVHEGTIPAVVALGMLMVIVSGGIDLSVGSVLALVTVVTMTVYRRLYQPDQVALASLAAVSAGITVGGLCGLINGLVITRLKVAPFVATLGMFSIARGVAVWLAERRLVDFPPGGRPRWVEDLATVHPGSSIVVDGQPVFQPAWYFFGPGFWLLMLLAAATALLLKATILGRYIYAIGSNEATARLCGVPVERTKLTVYVLAGLLTGLGGILLFAHGGSGDPSGAEGMELQVIAAVVIGGAALTGGVGTVTGTLLGVLILEVLSNGVSLFNVPVEIRHILIGIIIIANTALSEWQKRRG